MLFGVISISIGQHENRAAFPSHRDPIASSLPPPSWHGPSTWRLTSVAWPSRTNRLALLAQSSRAAGVNWGGSAWAKQKGAFFTQKTTPYGIISTPKDKKKTTQKQWTCFTTKWKFNDVNFGKIKKGRDLKHLKEVCII